jgi:hypothetical protein
MYRSTLIRFLAVPVCLLWGLTEFMALQRAHGRQRKHGSRRSDVSETSLR